MILANSCHKSFKDLFTHNLVIIVIYKDILKITIKEKNLFNYSNPI